MPKPDLQVVNIIRQQADYFAGAYPTGVGYDTWQSSGAQAWWTLPSPGGDGKDHFAFPQWKLGTEASYQAAADAAESAAYSEAMLAAKWSKKRPVCRKVRS
jgi:hypothetical protein